MQPLYVRLMTGLYWVCISIAVVAICTTTLLVFAGAMVRYLLGFGAMYSEQISIMFAIQMTFYGGAACYRAHAHLSLMLFARLLPSVGQKILRYFVNGVIMAIACSMIYWGIELVQTTMFQHYAEFPWEGLKVGYIYSAVPISGFILLLFAIEQFIFKSAQQFHADESRGSETETDILRKAQEGKA